MSKTAGLMKEACEDHPGCPCGRSTALRGFDPPVACRRRSAHHQSRSAPSAIPWPLVQKCVTSLGPPDNGHRQFWSSPTFRRRSAPPFSAAVQRAAFSVRRREWARDARKSVQRNPMGVEEPSKTVRPVTVRPTRSVQACGPSSDDVRRLIVDEEQLLGCEPEIRDDVVEERRRRLCQPVRSP